MLLAVLSIIGLPVLGFAAYKLLNRPPKTIIHVEHVKAEEENEPTPEPKKQPPPTAVAATDSNARPKYGPPRAAASSDGRVTSIDEAVDRIGEQFARAITTTKSHQELVVWLFDRSASNDRARSEVAGRLDAFYQQLATAAKAVPLADKKSASEQVLSVVGAFGSDVTFLTQEPTSDSAAVQKAVEGIKPDPSTVENTFAAVQAAVEKYSSYRLKGRFVSLVIVTDESGDDEAKIDKVLPMLERYAIPVYCIGVEASFAKAEGSNLMSEGRDESNKLRVRQGPDSRFPEWIHLQYPDGSDDNGQTVQTDVGPYSLARLCQETDGEYFPLPQIGGSFGGDSGFGPPRKGRNRGGMHGFVSGTLTLPRKYIPVYLPEAEVQAQLEKNKAKKALVEAARLPPAEVLRNPENRFENGEDQAKLTNALAAAQRPIAKLMPAIDAIYNALKAGEGDEPKLAADPRDARWQAAYDLAYGRALAAKSRADSFMQQVALLKFGMKFKDPKHMFWVLEETDDPTGVSVSDKMAAKARDLLNRVVKEHPGTPWAASAERELQTPLAWKWVEQ